MTARGLDGLLIEEGRRNERVINAFRVAAWTAVGVATLALTTSTTGRLAPESGVELGWAAAAAVLGLTVLRGRFPAWLGAALIAVDLLMVGASTWWSQQFLREHLPGRLEAEHQLHASAAAYLLVLCTSFLRYRWVDALLLSAFGAAVYAFVAIRMVGWHGGVGIDLVLLAIQGATAVYLSRRVAQVVRHARERDALARFLPGPAVERLSRDPAALDLGGAEQEATVLFADVRGFTTMSEAMAPAEVVAWLNEYFAEMVDEVFAWDGVLDKFLGDGLCAVFVPAVGGGRTEERAVRCALGMLGRLDGLNARRAARGQPPLRIGIGLHTGRVIAGNVGSPARMEYTHIGDTVNTAARLESLTKELGCDVLIGAETFRRAAVDVPSREVPPTVVRGRAEPLALVAVDAAAGARRDARRGASPR